MSLYEELGAKYDRMIRWKQRLEREAPFFQRLFAESRAERILDLGCGTGHHARLFSNWGLEVIGVDPSPALLAVAEGRSDTLLKLEPEETKLTFLEGSFENFHTRVEGPFDVILCLGNTLAHADSAENLRSLIAHVHGLLKPGGVFVGQMLNYTRLLRSQERFLTPTTFREGDSEQLFFRFNDYLGDKVQFNVAHFTRVGENWIQEIHSTTLTPWSKQQLGEELVSGEFAVRDWYGEFSGAPYDETGSPDLIFIARNVSGSEG